MTMRRGGEERRWSIYIYTMAVQEDVRKAGKECSDFDHVHELIERAEALEVEDLNPATTCRLRLALEALELAQRAGGACKARAKRRFSSKVCHLRTRFLYPSLL